MITRDALIGAYIQPPCLCGLEVPDEREPGAAQAIRDITIARGRHPVWEGQADGYGLVLTGAGGVFAVLPSEERWTSQGQLDTLHARVAELCNLVLCELTLQGVACAPFTPADLCHAQRDPDDTIAIWVAMGDFAPASFAIDSALRSGETQVIGRQRVTPAQVGDLADLPGARHLREVASTLPGFLAHAVAAARHQRAADCVLYAWTVCELLLDWLWATHVLAHASSNAHRKRLSDPNQYTAGVRSEMLWRLDVLSLEDLRKLNAARKARNDVAHRGRLHDGMTRTALAALNAMLLMEYETNEERAMARAGRRPLTQE